MARNNVKAALKKEKGALVAERQRISDQIDSFQLQVAQLQSAKASLNSDIDDITTTLAELDALP